MAINKKLIHFKTRANFDKQLAANNILDTSIAFILDTKQIWTHDTLYDCGSNYDNIVTLLENKVDKVSGKSLSTNDFTTELLNKLNSIASGAEVNVQSDWNATEGDAFIKNKPTKLSQFTNDSGYTTNTGTVTLVKVGSTTYNPSSGVVSIPAYPTIPSSLKNPTSMKIQLNGGTTEGTNLFTYDGSTAKTININPSNIGAAPTTHNHTKSLITDFPTSMPASDVYAWAKASSKPSYSYSEISGRPTKLSDFTNDVGYEANLNAFSNIKVGTTTISADSKTDTIELIVGNNINLTPDATNDKITISAINTTYGEATTSSAGLLSASDKVKLNSISNGAAVSSVNGKTGAVSISKSDISLGNVDNVKLIPNSEKGVANGVATLGTDGKIPQSLLPSYVDDVLEFTTTATFPTTGESGKIYVETSTNKTYRWSGSGYVEISQSLALGETSSTAYSGDKGKAVTDAFNNHNNDSTRHITSSERNTWNSYNSKFLPLSGGKMTGNISYNGWDIISFIEGTEDGLGIAIGGGGLTIVGGGEAASTVRQTFTTGNLEKLVLCSDVPTIDFYTNCQEGLNYSVHTTINGNLFSGISADANALGGKAASLYVTTDTNQSIFGSKTFDHTAYFDITEPNGSRASGITGTINGNGVGSFGFFCTNNTYDGAYIGWGPNPWLASDNLFVSSNLLTYKGLNVLHSGNSSISGNTITINGSSITPLTSHLSLSNYMSFGISPNYVSANFNNPDYAKTAAEKYIEFWDSSYGWFNFCAGKYIVAGGTSSQFLKADGSIDNDSNYLSLVSNRIVNFNEGLNKNGFYPWDPSSLNLPKSNTWGVMLQWSNSSNPTPGGNNEWITQLASCTNLNGLYYRTRTNSDDWGTWFSILTNNNYPDTLDARYYTENEVNYLLSNKVSKAGDLMSGQLWINASSSNVLNLNANNTNEIGIKLAMNATDKGWLGYVPVLGTYLYNSACDKYLALNDSGVPNVSGSVIWHQGNDGSGSGLDADLLDGHHKDDFDSVVRFNTTDSRGTGYYKIKIKDTNSWMLSFKILTYLSYTFDEINVLGYNYGENYWYAPCASLICSAGSARKYSVDVIFGYDSAYHLWVAIPCNSYTGISITNVVNGYNPVGDIHDLFEITYEASLSGTAQITLTAVRSALLNDTVSRADRATSAGSADTAVYAENAGNAATLDGLHVTSSSNTPFGTIPAITSSGWMDVGRSFEMHYDNTTGSDYSTRLACTGSYGNIVNLPSSSGTLALTTDLVAGAGYALSLYTTCYLWGQAFNGTSNISGSMSGIGSINMSGSISGTNSIELYSSTPFIDFHYNNSSADYTSRIIENAEGKLNLNNVLFAHRGHGVGIGMETPNYSLDVGGVIHAADGIWTEGYVSAKGQNTSSDLRLKDIIKDITLDIHDIANAPSVEFNWKDSGTKDIGSIAQYWLNLIPELTHELESGYLGLDYGKTALLSVISVAKEVEELKAENLKLKDLLLKNNII